jgi:hypothetical protein
LVRVIQFWLYETERFQKTLAEKAEARAEAEMLEVGRCRLKSVFASTEQDVFGMYDLLQPPCVMLCDLTTRYTIESAWLAPETKTRRTGFESCYESQLAPLHGGEAVQAAEQVEGVDGAGELLRVHR